MKKKILFWVGAALLLTPFWVFAEWLNHRGDSSLTGVSSGELETELTLEWTFDAGKFLKSSPVVSDKLVFLGGSTGNFHALDRVTGKEVWRKNIGVGVDAPALIQEGCVYVGTKDGFVVCLDAKTGEKKWSYETMGEIVGAPNIAAHPEDGRLLLLVGSYDNFIHCLDAKDGKLLWKFETMNYINGTPAIWDKQAVVFGGCDAQLYVISLLDGQLIRQVDLGAPIASSVGLMDRFGYVGNMDKSVQAIDLTTGQLVWSYQPKNFPYFSSPALNEDLVIIGGRDKGLHGIDRKTGSKVWRYAARGRIDSSPVIVGEKVVVGTMDGKLCLIRLNSGELITEYEIGASISSTCAVSDGWIFVGCEDGTLYTFSTKSP
ncbi:MAG: PQQ-binding-like beta-propeller repeat protein [Opitutales bacterium]